MILYISYGIILIGCGDSGSTQDSVNNNFEKFNRHLDLLPSTAISPVESEPTLFQDNEWVISKKKGTNFFISEKTQGDMMITSSEAKEFCSKLAIDSQGLPWRLPTTNELLVIAELHPVDKFYWSADTTNTVFAITHDSVQMIDGFICKAQYMYDVDTKFGFYQHYCNEQLNGKYAGCVADSSDTNFTNSGF